MQTVRYVALAVVPLLSAWIALRSRRTQRAALALAANSLSLALIALVLDAPFVAAVWAIMGLATALTCYVSSAPRNAGRAAKGSPLTVRPLMALLGLALAICLAGILRVNEAPGLLALGPGSPAPAGEEMAALVAMLSVKYAPTLIGIGLILLVAVLGLRPERSEP